MMYRNVVLTGDFDMEGGSLTETGKAQVVLIADILKKAGGPAVLFADASRLEASAILARELGIRRREREIVPSAFEPGEKTDMGQFARDMAEAFPPADYAVFLVEPQRFYDILSHFGGRRGEEEYIRRLLQNGRTIFLNMATKAIRHIC